MRHCLNMLGLALSLSLAGSTVADELPLVHSDDFESGTADAWQPLGASQWNVVKEDDGNHAYRVEGKGSYKPPYRSPLHISLLKDHVVGDFAFSTKAKSTSRVYGHQDLCLFFGYQDPGHFYYVHLGRETDPHANQIFIVNGAARKAITAKQSPGTNWGKDWHNVKVVRNAESGLIEVYFDDMETPAMTADDKTFTWGQVGLGTFDDHGNWDNVQLHGKKAERPEAK